MASTIPVASNTATDIFSKIHTWVKWLLDYLIKYLKNPTNIRYFVCQWGSVLFRLPLSDMMAAWDSLWELVQAAAKEFPAAGTGESKYQYVAEIFKKEFPTIATHVMDFILHTLLPAAATAGVTT